jgi:hypothetical protein
MAAPVCFPVSQGAIVGGLNSWSSEAPCSRQRANSRMVDTSRCAALAYQLYEELSCARGEAENRHLRACDTIIKNDGRYRL